MTMPSSPEKLVNNIETCCPIIELRQYTHYPDQRDVLISLFEREFIETQEVLGMSVIGHFRDLDDPDRYVWLRGFENMQAREDALRAFYTGPVWKTHRNEANATLIDSDNVLLLHPAYLGAGFAPPTAPRPSVDAQAQPSSLVMATIYYFKDAVDESFVRFFRERVVPFLTETGAQPIACLESERAENTYPSLPVREGEHVFVWLTLFASLKQYDRHLAKLAASEQWNSHILPRLQAYLSKPPEVLRLQPAKRSHIR